MCKCGSRSQRIAAPPYARPDSVVGTGDARLAGARAAQEFVYIGRTALTAMGPRTGTAYRFHHTGARVRVDIRDAPSMAQIPVLRRV